MTPSAQPVSGFDPTNTAVFLRGSADDAGGGGSAVVYVTYITITP